MQINDLIQKKNNINVFEDFTNFELEMAKIPDGHEEEGDLTDVDEPENIVYKWDKKLQNWSYNIKVKSDADSGDRFQNKKWIYLTPQPSQDDEGKPFLDKDGKQQKTKYSRRWRHYVEKAGREIDRKKDDSKPAIETQPIKDKQTFKYGKQEYIYDNKLNLWFNKSTKQQVDKNSLLNATLMANYGFKPDGQRELDPTYKEQFLTWVTKGLPDWLKKGGRLGQDSQVSARNFGGRRGGEVGDLLGRLLISKDLNLPGKITDMLFGPKPQTKPQQPTGQSGDPTTKGTSERPPEDEQEPNDKPSTGMSNPYDVNTMELRQKINFALRNEKTNTKVNTQTGSKEYIDPYKMMDLKNNATDEEIKQRWKILSQMYHPDKGSDGEVFKMVNSAYNQIKLMRPGIK
jgi:hypothetical protein